MEHYDIEKKLNVLSWSSDQSAKTFGELLDNANKKKASSGYETDTDFDSSDESNGGYYHRAH